MSDADKPAPAPPRRRYLSGARLAMLGVIVNAFLGIVKILAGVLGNSYALIADAIESTSDIFASVLVLIGLRYAQKPADENHPYGHGRAETLSTFAVVLFLVASALLIGHDAIKNIQTPHQTPHPFTLIVLGAIILIKELYFRFVEQKSKETGSLALKADAWHHRSDAITSLAAFIGIAIALLLGPGYEAADDWAALLASGFILFNAYLIFRPALGEFMDEHVYDDLIEKIRVFALQVEGVRDTEKCFIRKTGMRYYVDLHAIVDGRLSVREGHDIAHRLKDRLMLEIPELSDVLVHIEPC